MDVKKLIKKTENFVIGSVFIKYNIKEIAERIINRLEIYFQLFKNIFLINFFAFFAGFVSDRAICIIVPANNKIHEFIIVTMIAVTEVTFIFITFPCLL